MWSDNKKKNVHKKNIYNQPKKSDKTIDKPAKAIPEYLTLKGDSLNTQKKPVSCSL